MKNFEEDDLKKAIKEANCVPGINYVSLYEDNGIRWIHEIYLKNYDEYKVVGIWHHDDNKKLDKYSQAIYDELLNQGLNESGCMFIALDVKNKKEFDKMMKYLESVRNKTISYTELWTEKNKIVSFDSDKVNVVKVDE